MDQQDKKLWDLLDASTRAQAPEGFAQSVMRLITQEQQHSVPVVEVARISWFTKVVHSKPAWLTAASACAAAIALMVAINSDHDAPVGTQSIAINEIDDQILLDFACSSLGNEDLQDAVYQISSVDALTELDVTEMLFSL